MNPEIKEHIEKYYGNKLQLTEDGTVYFIRIGTGQSIKAQAIRGDFFKKISRSPITLGLEDDDWIYPFESQWLTETKMLRLLRLKAFW
jgi:hypothetical protein